MEILLNGAAPVLVPMPSGLTPFALPDGTRFQLNLVDANREISRLAKVHEHDESGTHLDAFAAWVQKQAGVTLNSGQADWLWEYVLTERAKAGQVFRDTLRSLSSTDSAPSD